MFGFLLVWDWPLFWARFLIVVVCLLCAEGAFIWTHWSFNVFHPFSTHCFNTFRIVQDFCEKLDIQAAAGLLWNMLPYDTNCISQYCSINTMHSKRILNESILCETWFFLIIPLEILFPVVVPRGSFPRYPGLSHHTCAIVRVCPGLTKQKGFASEHLVKPCDIFVKILMILLESPSHDRIQVNLGQKSRLGLGFPSNKLDIENMDIW